MQEEIMVLKEQVQENHRLLKENNVLLREIIKQNQLIAEITQETIEHYVPVTYHLWPKPEKLKNMKKELKNLYEDIIKSK